MADLTAAEIELARRALGYFRDRTDAAGEYEWDSPTGLMRATPGLDIDGACWDLYRWLDGAWRIAAKVRRDSGSDSPRDIYGRWLDLLDADSGASAPP